MRITYIDMENIDYSECEYDEMLFQSIKRIGCSFPIRVIQKGTRYECIDGHKRLSILHELLKQEALTKDRRKIAVMIQNDGSMRSDGGWSLRNHH